jgi:spore maturation protein SpmB
MQTVVEIILKSGESGINLALYILMPVMVVMMAIMRVLEEKGILTRIATLLTPLMFIFGLPGLGVFAILQLLLISFAAPIATLKILDHDKGIPGKRIAASLAAIFTMSQANATFPLVVVGLNLPVIMTTSLVGGLLAGFIAYRLAPDGDEQVNHLTQSLGFKNTQKEKAKFLPTLFKGGEEGLQLAFKAIPPLILALLAVNIFRATGVIGFLESLLSPILALVGIPGIAVLPIVTKYLAGGTAMMAITLELIADGSITVAELNRFVGFTINPLDPVGVALLISAGPRVAAQVSPAIKGALVGLIFRAILHLIIF